MKSVERLLFLGNIEEHRLRRYIGDTLLATVLALGVTRIVGRSTPLSYDFQYIIPLSFDRTWVSRAHVDFTLLSLPLL